MDCNELRSHITEFLYQETEPEISRQVEAHLAGCESCKRQVEAVKTAREIYRNLPDVEPSASALSNAIATAQTEEVGPFAKEKPRVVIRGSWFERMLKHPLFATAAVVMFVSILILRNWDTDDVFINKKIAERNRQPQGGFVASESVFGKNKEQVKLNLSVDKRKDDYLDRDVEALLEQAEKTRKAVRQVRKTARAEMNRSKASLVLKERVLSLSSAVKPKRQETVGELAKTVKVKDEAVLSLRKNRLRKSTVNLEVEEVEVVNQAEKKATEQRTLVEVKEKKARALDGKNNFTSVAASPLLIGGGDEPELDASLRSPIKKVVALATKKKALTPKQILEQAFDSYHKKQYAKALALLQMIAEKDGEVRVAAVELQTLCYYALKNNEALQQSLDVLTRINPVLGARLARKLSSGVAVGVADKAAETQP